MLFIVCAILAAGLTVLTAISAGFTGWALLFTVPICIGYAFSLVALTLIVCFFASLPENVNKPRTKPVKFFRVAFDLVNGFLCDFGGARIRVSGEEKLDPKRRYLFTINHRSNFDPMVIARHFRKYDLIFLSKTGNFKIPIAGKCIHLAGYLPLDRENDREALKAILQSIRYLKEGYSIGVFPEGTRNKEGADLLPFRNGCFKIALKAKAPIALLTVSGCENIHKNFPFKRTIVHIDVLDVLEPEDFENLSTAQIGEIAAAEMQKHINSHKEKNER